MLQVNEGPGMYSMPLRCSTCGKEWWWNFGPGGPSGRPKPPRCECGGRFTQSAPPRCPKCGSTDVERDPEGDEIMYD